MELSLPGFLLLLRPVSGLEFDLSLSVAVFGETQAATALALLPDVAVTNPPPPTSKSMDWQFVAALAHTRRARSASSWARSALRREWIHSAAATHASPSAPPTPAKIIVDVSGPARPPCPSMAIFNPFLGVCVAGHFHSFE